MAFANVDDLATLLGETFDAVRSAQGELAIELASTAIRASSGQVIDLVEDDTVVLAGVWDEDLPLPQRPVLEVSEVLVDGTADTGWDLVGSSLRRETGWGGSDVLVSVTYSHGYEIVPPVVRSICLQSAARFMINPEASAGTVRLTLEEAAMLPRLRSASVPIR